MGGEKFWPSVENVIITFRLDIVKMKGDWFDEQNIRTFAGIILDKDHIYGIREPR